MRAFLRRMIDLLTAMQGLSPRKAPITPCMPARTPFHLGRIRHDIAWFQYLWGPAAEGRDISAKELIPIVVAAAGCI